MKFSPTSCSHLKMSPLPTSTSRHLHLQHLRRGFAQIPSLHVSRKLSDIVKLPLLQRESPQKVREVWLSHDKPRIINGVLAAPEWRASAANAKAAPLFVVPVYPDPAVTLHSTKHVDGTATTTQQSSASFTPASAASSTAGYYNLVSEWQDEEIVLTFLDDYQKDARNAVPFMVVNFFTELLSSHNLVLLRADIVNRNLSRKQGALAVKFLREAYARVDRFEWVQKFNLRPREFDYRAFESWCSKIKAEA
ncbi:unnamed protein product [Amoebophrya sp. A120]|nr:unnamed protein product [Amoebophrya sp. A120]|eukprot:GSA120T00024252001.1